MLPSELGCKWHGHNWQLDGWPKGTMDSHRQAVIKCDNCGLVERATQRISLVEDGPWQITYPDGEGGHYTETIEVRNDNWQDYYNSFKIEKITKKPMLDTARRLLGLNSRC